MAQVSNLQGYEDKMAGVFYLWGGTKGINSGSPAPSVFQSRISAVSPSRCLAFFIPYGQMMARGAVKTMIFHPPHLSISHPLFLWSAGAVNPWACVCPGGVDESSDALFNSV